MTIDLTREGILEELKNGNAVIKVKDPIEAKEIKQMTEVTSLEIDGFFYNGENGLDFYKEVTIKPFYSICFEEFTRLPSYREPIIELSKEIVGTRHKFVEDLKNGEGELEVFGAEDKVLIGDILGLSLKLRVGGPYLYLDEEIQELRFHREPSDKPIVLDMRRFLELK